MTELDRALENFQQDMEDPKNQSQFYDLILNTTFFVPTVDEKGPELESGPGAEGQVVPLVLEAEGNDYLMLFDTVERLNNWAQAEVSFVEVPGHVIAELSTPPLHWALNVGAERSKQFVPEEIAWLRDVVEHCLTEEGQGQE